jgi:hypothetical protein
MKYKFSVLFVLFLAGFYSAVKCQEIKNFQAVQEGNQIKITYDLSGGNKKYDIKLYYSLDKGKTWLGPMLRISGDAGTKMSSGTNKLVIWDALSEQGPFEGMVQFKIETEIMADKVAEIVQDLSQKKEISKKDSLTQREKKADRQKKAAGETVKVTKPEPEKTTAEEKTLQKNAGKPSTANQSLKKLKTTKIVFLGAAITSAAVGIYSLQQGNSLYSKYNSGSEDAANLRKKIEGFDKIVPIGFGIAGLCGAGFIYEILRTGKIKKQVTFNPFPVNGGGGVMLTLNF